MVLSLLCLWSLLSAFRIQIRLISYALGIECWERREFLCERLLDIQIFTCSQIFIRCPRKLTRKRHNQKYILLFLLFLCLLSKETPSIIFRFLFPWEEERENQITDDIPNKSLVVTVCYLMVLWLSVLFLSLFPLHLGTKRYDVDGQWLTFPFPFVHHQPLHIF